LQAHAVKMLTQYVKRRLGKQMVNVRDASVQRILNRDHGQASLAILHRRKRILERLARQRDHVGIDFATGQMRVGAGLTLNIKRSSALLSLLTPAAVVIV
jgi:hypothetical protein